MAAWFDPNLFAWIPGTAFGVVAGCWGSAAGALAGRGLGRSAILGSGWALVAASVGLAAAGLAAVALRQPYGVWYGLLLPGALGLVLLPARLPSIRRAYRAAEERRMGARDMPL